MHAWSRYIQEYLDAHPGKKPADLARDSGVSPQLLSTILNDPRSRLTTRPDEKTVVLLAKAMGVSPDVLLSKVGVAMGLPVNRAVVVYDASRASNEDLIQILASRLKECEDRARQSAPTNQAAVSAAPEFTHEVLELGQEGAARQPESPHPRRHPNGSG